jgi:hypothetical protein
MPTTSTNALRIPSTLRKYALSHTVQNSQFILGSCMITISWHDHSTDELQETVRPPVRLRISIPRFSFATFDRSALFKGPTFLLCIQYLDMSRPCPPLGSEVFSVFCIISTSVTTYTHIAGTISFDDWASAYRVYLSGCTCGLQGRLLWFWRGVYFCSSSCSMMGSTV